VFVVVYGSLTFTDGECSLVSVPFPVGPMWSRSRLGVVGVARPGGDGMGGGCSNSKRQWSDVSVSQSVSQSTGRPAVSRAEVTGPTAAGRRAAGPSRCLVRCLIHGVPDRSSLQLITSGRRLAVSAHGSATPLRSYFVLLHGLN